MSSAELLYSLQHHHHSQGQMRMPAASPATAAAKMTPWEHSLLEKSGSQDAPIHRGPGWHILKMTGK